MLALLAVKDIKLTAVFSADSRFLGLAFYAFYAFYAWWIYFQQSGALAAYMLGEKQRRVRFTQHQHQASAKSCAPWAMKELTAGRLQLSPTIGWAHRVSDCPQLKST
jgi:hypothetical protein